jgi:hypothetical protein
LEVVEKLKVIEKGEFFSFFRIEREGSKTFLKKFSILPQLKRRGNGKGALKYPPPPESRLSGFGGFTSAAELYRRFVKK